MSTSILRTSPQWACPRRNRVRPAGVVGLGRPLARIGVHREQFALLAFAPLLVVAPRDRRTRFVGATVLSIAAIVGPLSAFASTRAISVRVGWVGGFLRSQHVAWSAAPTRGAGARSSRFAPIALAMVTARWSLKRNGSDALEPVPLIALVATSLSYRLVFEVNLWGYYFMAVAVLLVVLDVVQGRIRVLLFVWLALVAIAFCPTPHFGPASPLWLPLWLWQLALVPIAIALAANPLRSRASARAARTGNPLLVRL